MALIICGMCRKKFESTESMALPFCSVRCQQVDLNRWLGERYSFPTTRTDDEDEEGEKPNAADESE